MESQQHIVIAVLICLAAVLATSRGQMKEDCLINNNTPGTCKNANDCQTNALESTQCSSSRTNSRVCCPISAPLSTPKNPRKPVGKKSSEMCVEYAKHVIQKLVSPVFLKNPGKYEVNLCMARLHAPNQKPLPEAEHAISREYPHMAYLGYGDKGSIEWLCAGSLISESYILTTARCLTSPTNTNISWAHLGDIRGRNQKYPFYEDIEVVETHKHGDIALLKLKTKVEISPAMRPACLYYPAGNPPGYEFATTTGWGAHERDSKSSSNELKKKDLSFEDCGKSSHGVSDSTYICVSNPDTDDKSPCVVDYGSPLQVVVSEPYCMNSIIGLASLGKETCTDDGKIAVYIRISPHIQWIEDIVWSS